MRVVANLAHEFEEMCANYNASSDPAGKDIVTLVYMFGDEYDDLSPGIALRVAWDNFLDEHKHQILVSPMCGLILHILITYWQSGHALFEALPTLEKMLIRDTVHEISEEIERRSRENGSVVAPG